MPKSGVANAQRAKVFNALGEGTRLRIVDLLAASAPDELASSIAARKLGVSLALYCHHAKILAEAGILTKRREGQTVYCSLVGDALDGAATKWLAAVSQKLRAAPEPP